VDFEKLLRVYIYNQRSSPHVIALEKLTSTQLLPLKTKDRLKELVQLCFIKKNAQSRYKYLVVGQILFDSTKKLDPWSS
jgi:hypothetical protein